MKSKMRTQAEIETKRQIEIRILIHQPEETTQIVIDLKLNNNQIEIKGNRIVNNRCRGQVVNKKIEIMDKKILLILL